MRSCSHTQWLGIAKDGDGVSLLETGRLHALINKIQSPDTSKPALIVLIGKSDKVVAHRAMYGAKKAGFFRNKRRAGDVHLSLHPQSASQVRPLLVADTEITDRSFGLASHAGGRCHTTRTRPMLRDRLSMESVGRGILTELLFPFVDVFCLFSSDIGGFRQVARLLAQWVDAAVPLSLPDSIRPRILVVSDKIGHGPVHEIEARKALLWLLREETENDPFKKVSAIEVVALLPSREVSCAGRHRYLKERIAAAVDRVREGRWNARFLFSARHFAAFTSLACDHFSGSDRQPFDFITASRLGNPVPSEMTFHMSNFVQCAKTPKMLMDFIAPSIASSILLASYPPEAHAFDPGRIFNTLYRDILNSVSNSRSISFRDSDEILLLSGLVRSIETSLISLFQQFTEGATTAADLHKDHVRLLSHYWCNTFLDGTCLLCLSRRPSRGLECGHCICDICVTNFGDTRDDDPWEYSISRCYLCEKLMNVRQVIRVHPPTGGAGLLCIDGGGVKGAIPLEFLKRIEQQIDLPIPIQRFFKVAFGVSSGGLIVLALFQNGWSLSKTSDLFQNLARLAFQGHKLLGIPGLSYLQKLWLSYFNDGLYPVRDIEDALKRVFSENSSIIDCSYATATGTKIGIPVATVGNKPACRLFTNDNGANETDNGRVIKPAEGFARVPVWEIARATSAAPFFFPPKYVAGVGLFQDAGLLENDPVGSAQAEVAAEFQFAEEPDFILSLGTGSPRVSDDVSFFKGTPRLGKLSAFRRVLGLIWEKTRDKQIKYILDLQAKYYRLDIDFDKAEPRLDDEGCIPELQERVRANKSTSETITRVASCMIASLFYLELDSLPVISNGRSVGTGKIKCVLRANSSALSILLQRLKQESAEFCLNDAPIPGGFRDEPMLCSAGSFLKCFKFEVVDRFNISLMRGDARYCPISGSPFTIQRLISAQKLNAPFGTANHRKRRRDSEQDSQTSKRRRSSAKPTAYLLEEP